MIFPRWGLFLDCLHQWLRLHFIGVIAGKPQSGLLFQKKRRSKKKMYIRCEVPQQKQLFLVFWKRFAMHVRSLWICRQRTKESLILQRKYRIYCNWVLSRQTHLHSLEHFLRVHIQLLNKKLTQAIKYGGQRRLIVGMLTLIQSLPDVPSLHSSDTPFSFSESSNI